jgi:hypothetical protein
MFIFLNTQVELIKYLNRKLTVSIHMCIALYHKGLVFSIIYKYNTYFQMAITFNKYKCFSY